MQLFTEIQSHVKSYKHKARLLFLHFCVSLGYQNHTQIGIEYFNILFRKINVKCKIATSVCFESEYNHYFLYYIHLLCAHNSVAIAETDSEALCCNMQM